MFSENNGTAATVAELFSGHGCVFDDFLDPFVGAASGGGAQGRETTALKLGTVGQRRLARDPPLHLSYH